jgi:hypothetical protein
LAADHRLSSLVAVHFSLQLSLRFNYDCAMYQHVFSKTNSFSVRVLFQN